MDQVNVHHITLSVTNVKASATWYQRLLGEATCLEDEAPPWKRTSLLWPGGLIIVLTQHDTTMPDDRFAPERVGLDHISLGCENEASVSRWLARMDDQGIAHGPVEDAAYGWVLTAKDPDGIPIEFFCPKT